MHCTILSGPSHMSGDVRRCCRVWDGQVQESGRPWAIYEIANNNCRRSGIPEARLHYTRIAALKLRPEGTGSGVDHPGFGKLLFGVAEEGGE